MSWNLKPRKFPSQSWTNDSTGVFSGCCFIDSLKISALSLNLHSIKYFTIVSSLTYFVSWLQWLKSRAICFRIGMRKSKEIMESSKTEVQDSEEEHETSSSSEDVGNRSGFINFFVGYLV